LRRRYGVALVEVHGDRTHARFGDGRCDSLSALPPRAPGHADGRSLSGECYGDGRPDRSRAAAHERQPTHRVLRPRGLFVAATVSRHDSPELAPHWQPKPTTFDAEDAPELVYILARQAIPAVAETTAANLPAPLTVTKRSAAIYARRS
jgi:hypothetical protein